MNRHHSLHILKHPAGWLFCFPAMPLLLAQSPTLMKCEQCGAEFLKRSKIAWVCRILLCLTIYFYVWIFIEIVAQLIRE
jgi:hypothetical protein